MNHKKNNGVIWSHTSQNMEVTVKIVIFQCKSRLGWLKMSIYISHFESDWNKNCRYFLWDNITDNKIKIKLINEL